jgi:cyclase
MHPIRIIPCLDIKNGEVVKGEKFLHLKNIGSPLELAKKYNRQQADELVFLDITATNQKRDTLVDLASKVAKEIFIPFTVGGGIASAHLAEVIIKAGADKVAVNSAALKEPRLITQISEQFGSQCVVLAVDVKRKGDDWVVFSHAGEKNTGRGVVEWVEEAWQRGAGEILITSMDKDGTKSGYDNEINHLLSDKFPIPLIASGGCGKLEHFLEAVKVGKADAILAASVFHYDIFQIQEVKKFLWNNKIPVRL